VGTKKSFACDSVYPIFEYFARVHRTVVRPLRIEFAGALYHVTSRGDRREDIYESDADRENFLEILSEVCRQHNWSIHAYCLMTNHYHLLVETPDANLSKGMRQLNGVYTQKYNRLNHKVGHVFQGRYKSILVDGDSYLLELARYVVLNPVRAQMVRSAKDWRWSSYRATVGVVSCPEWLDRKWVLSGFAKRQRTAIEGFKKFVALGKNQPSPWEQLKNQIFLGDEQFVERALGFVDDEKSLSEIPMAQRRSDIKPIDDYVSLSESRNEAIFTAYRSGHYTLAEIGDYFNLHYSTIGGIVKNYE